MTVHPKRLYEISAFGHNAKLLFTYSADQRNVKKLGEILVSSQTWCSDHLQK